MDDILSWLDDEYNRLARAEADHGDKLLADVHRGFDEAETNITLLLTEQARRNVSAPMHESESAPSPDGDPPPVADRKSPLEEIVGAENVKELRAHQYPLASCILADFVWQHITVCCLVPINSCNKSKPSIL